MKQNIVTNPFDFYDEEDDEEIEAVGLSTYVENYLKHLSTQEEWADTEWLPGDLY